MELRGRWGRGAIAFNVFKFSSDDKLSFHFSSSVIENKKSFRCFETLKKKLESFFVFYTKVDSLIKIG